MAAFTLIAKDPTSMMTVEQAIVGRQSIRAFLPEPVPRELIEKLLEIAGRAPSGSNIQPWKVVVLTGEAKSALCADLMALHEAGEDGSWQYPYYSDVWREPYLERRRRTGWGLYGTLGITKGDRAATRAQQGRNYLFFDAPVGLIFTIDQDLARGSWLDYGMFLQSIMIAARAVGLETCAQAAFCAYHAAISRRLRIPDVEMIVCGMALGYADPQAPVNTFRTERMGTAEFARFVDRLEA
jgi:nitroreductase